MTAAAGKPGQSLPSASSPIFVDRPAFQSGFAVVNELLRLRHSKGTREEALKAVLRELDTAANASQVSSVLHKKDEPASGE